MFCKLWDRKPRSGKSVWNTLPCVCVRSHSIVRHEQSELHIEAVKLENEKKRSERDGGIVASFERVFEAEEASLTSAFMCLYWLCKEESHTTKYSSLLDLVGLLDTNVLHLNKGGNATYRSQRSIAEFLSLISDNIRMTTKHELDNSPYVGLMIDETTDLSTIKQLIVYAKCLVRPQSEDGTKLGGISVWSRFLGIVELTHADAENITQVLLTLLNTQYQIGMQELKSKLAGFGSDGANVMVGKHAGVSAKLRELVPSLISVHCAAHRLALAASETALQVSTANRFKGIINSLFHYLQQSPARSARFVEVQKALCLPELKLKEAKDVRWLSCSQAVIAVQKNLLPLTIFLISDAEEGDATALGLATALQTYEFVAGVFFMAEVLPHLARLSLCFQEERLMWDEVQPLLDATLKVLSEIENSAKRGSCEWQVKLAAYIQQAEQEDITISCSSINRRSSINVKEKFLEEFCMPYLEILQSNLRNRFPPEDLSFLATFQLFDPTISLISEKVHEIMDQLGASICQ